MAQHDEEQEAIEVVRELLSSTKLLASEESIEGGIRFRIALDGPAEEGVAEVHTDIERFALVLMFASAVPEPQRRAVGELVTRINWGLMEGAFALNLDSGRLCYKAGFGYAGGRLEGPIVRNTVLNAMETIEVYVDAIVDVANGNEQPRAAYEAAEKRAGEGRDAP